MTLRIALAILVTAQAPVRGDTGSSTNVPEVRPFVFPLAQPPPAEWGGGGLFAHDVDSNGTLDLVVVGDDHVGAYTSTGETLWVRKADVRPFDYAHHPSAIAGDMDGDGRPELAFFTRKGGIVVLDATTGAPERTLAVEDQPVAMAIANLRGLGDREILLQYDQSHLKAIRAEDGGVLWETEEYRGIEHSPLRQADLDGDGLDEVAGANIIDHDGTKMNAWDLGGAYRSADSLVIADIVPGLPLEVALAEQRGANSHTDVVNRDRIVFRALNPWNWEDPDKVAVGDFDPARPGLEVFNRSSGGDGTAPRKKEEPYRHEEAPWVLDAAGELICKYYINDTKPAWWTGHGLEEISRIDWDGDEKDEIVGKERHRNGAGAVVDPITGAFRVTFPAKAIRIYAADVLGDAREEVIILDEDGTVKIFRNREINPHPPKARYWTQQHYRRQKQNWNYYSP